jgi:hypothetical protein
MSEDLQPDTDQVLQVEPIEPYGDVTPVAVCLDGPVRTQALPAKGGAMFTRTVGTTPTRVAGADHRRRTLKIVAKADVFVATSRAGIQSAIDTPDNHEAFEYVAAASRVLEIGATVDVWVAAVTGTAKVSVLTELWAAGDGPA